MNFLFVVCGEGLGHASRCFHLGHYFRQQGQTVHFAAYGKSFDFISQQGCANVHRTNREVCLEGVNGFFSLKETLWCSKWIVPNMVLSALRVGQLIRQYSIDCVVCDTMFGGVIAARLCNVPVAFVTNQNHFNGPGGTTTIVWEVLNFLIQWYLRIATRVIIPDYPAPDTISEYNIIVPNGQERKYTFAGPFLDVNPQGYSYCMECIFASFGGEPYKLPMYEMLKSIAVREKDLIFDVFYTGAKLPDSSGNFISHGYVPDIYEHLAKARIAIVHGGLTTLHEALLFEKPVLIIMDPNHPEQQNNAKKIVAMGAGTSVDGRVVTKEVLEKKISETMAMTPKPFCAEHACINGRQNAYAIIAALVRRRQP